MKAKFDAWRQRPGTRRPFPKAFWRDVIALQKDYKLSKILTALKISRSQLESKERQLMGKTKPVKKSIAPANEFIAVDFDNIQQVPLPEVTEINVAESLSIELIRPDGTVLKVSQLSTQAIGRRQFADLIRHFPEQVEYALQLYKVIGVNESTIIQQQLSPEQRLAYHQTHSLSVMSELRAWG